MMPNNKIFRTQIVLYSSMFSNKVHNNSISKHNSQIRPGSSEVENV